MDPSTNKSCCLAQQQQHIDTTSQDYINTHKNKLIEEFRECYNHKPQPTPDTTRKYKKDRNELVLNKQTNARKAQIPLLSSQMLNRTEKKHENKEQGKTQHETPRTYLYKAE